ncbi:uncharacterized protein cep295 isoform X2 [Solea solea]|uniref:uncharacterized protein cep295 isoform X2 n=1 Tax=Solea solea TaxID=90069 RepID=UPI00272AE362|nr:uncharacterized protein cep295 isoform X2 [Solea solea]
MKKKLARIRPSPNEEARILKEEHERRRKLRIQQVREQQRQIALQIRQAVEQRRQCELEQLGEELRLDWEQQQREKLDKLQRLYQESLQLLGQGHRDAKENEPDLAAIAQREEDNHAKAEQRHQQALKELKSQRLEEHERQNKSISARKKALQTEKERSAKVASLPPPPPNPIQNIDFKKPHVVKKSDVSSFAATHYHMPESTVDREVDTQQRNAHEEADLEVRRLQDLQREAMRRREEQLEKARLRGKQALKREQLIQDRDRLLVELEHMQQTDMLRRRQQVSQMPPQIFQPLYKRQEAREEFQREMEFAFEDMYTGERRVKGDLVVQLEPEPLPALSTGSQDQELDVTLDEITIQGTEHASHDAEHEAARTELDTSAQVEPTKPAPRRALRKLLDRIRSQRNQYNEHSSHVPAADSQTVVNDQIPERDTTIETGSLTNSPPSSDEKNKQPSIELPEPHSAIESETTETSTGGDSLFSDKLRNRIQEFDEEQKKREEELEREKQQQVVLLQDLENQKVKLEQMLLEAQQERERLKADAKQQVNVNQPDVSEQDQDLLSVCPGQAPELQPPAGEHNHTHRIREYQQRLLEQNGIHQRSVEVARRRLEEYQRALRIRYNRTSTSLLPAVLPTGLRPQPPHRSQSMQLSMPSHGQNQPQTFLEVPTRESDAHVSSVPLPGSSLIAGSKMQPDEMESNSNNSRNHRLEQSVWLTDNIMERVTGHLPERVRLCSPTMQPQHKLSSSTIPLQLHPDSPISPSSLPLDHAALGKSGTLLHGPLQTASLSSKDDDMERWRLELQDVQRRVLEQREAVVQRQSLQQEERQRQEEQQRRQEMEMEQMRQQKETLQALIDTDSQSTADGAAEVQVTENIGQTRLRLLVSLLQAIEESNGGTLSHLENPQEDCSNSNMTGSITQISAPVGPAPASILPPGLFLPPARAAKPPVTRIRLGTMAAGTDQHELSAIPEVETPVNISQVTDLGVSMNFPSHTGAWDLQEQSDLSVSSVSHTTGRTPSSGSSSSRSSHWVWRERLLTGAWTSPEYSESDSFQRKTSPFSSDSGRGADYPAPALTSYRSPTESRQRCPDSDLSSTISTGSYVTTDFEENTNTDKPPPLGPSEEQSPRAVVSSVSGQSFFIKDNSAAPCPGSIIRDAAVAVHPSSLVERSAAGRPGSLVKRTSAAGRPGSLVERTSAAGRPGSLVERTSAAGRPGSLVERTSAAGRPGSLVERTSAAGRPGSLVERTSAAGRLGSLVERTSAAGRPGSSVERTSAAGRPGSSVEGISAAGRLGSSVERTSAAGRPGSSVERTSAAGRPGSSVERTSAAGRLGSLVEGTSATGHLGFSVEGTSAARHLGSFIESMSAAGRPDSLVERRSAAGLPSSLVEETSAAGRPDSLVEGISAEGRPGSLVEGSSAAGRPGSLVEGSSAAGRPGSLVEGSSAAGRPGSLVEVTSAAGRPGSLVEVTSAAGHSGSLVEVTSAAGRPGSLVEGTSAAGRPGSLDEGTSAAGCPGSLVEGTSTAGGPGSLVEGTSAAGSLGSSAAGRPGSLDEGTSAAGCPGSLVEGTSTAGGPGSLVEGTSAAGSLGSSVEDTLDAGCLSSLVEGTSAVGCSGSLVEDRSVSVHPDVVVESLFNDRSIQRIIDRYTRELDVSLSIAGKTTDSEGLSVEEAGSSLSQSSLVQGSKRQVEDKGAQGPQTPLLHTAGTRTQSSLQSDTTADLLLVQPSQAEDSFRPLIGQLADQSSCLAVDSAMEQLVGQPFAHSSMIGQLSSVPGQGGWDSTLSRIISRLSHQWSSGQNCNSGQLMGPMVEEPSTSWLDEGQEESRMRPLVAELDTDHHSGVSGEFTHLNLGVSAEDSLPSHPALPAEASSHSATAPGVSRRSEEQMPLNQTSPVLLESESTEGEFFLVLTHSTHCLLRSPTMKRLTPS